MRFAPTLKMMITLFELHSSTKKMCHHLIIINQFNDSRAQLFVYIFWWYGCQDVTSSARNMIRFWSHLYFNSCDSHRSLCKQSNSNQFKFVEGVWTQTDAAARTSFSSTLGQHLIVKRREHILCDDDARCAGFFGFRSKLWRHKRGAAEDKTAPIALSRWVFGKYICGHINIEGKNHQSSSA